MNLNESLTRDLKLIILIKNSDSKFIIFITKCLIIDIIIKLNLKYHFWFIYMTIHYSFN
jgi:hypothetical protein